MAVYSGGMAPGAAGRRVCVCLLLQAVLLYCVSVSRVECREKI